MDDGTRRMSFTIKRTARFALGSLVMIVAGCDPSDQVDGPGDGYVLRYDAGPVDTASTVSDASAGRDREQLDDRAVSRDTSSVPDHTVAPDLNSVADRATAPDTSSPPDRVSTPDTSSAADRSAALDASGDGSCTIEGVLFDSAEARCAVVFFIDMSCESCDALFDSRVCEDAINDPVTCTIAEPCTGCDDEDTRADGVTCEEIEAYSYFGPTAAQALLEQVQAEGC